VPIFVSSFHVELLFIFLRSQIYIRQFYEFVLYDESSNNAPYFDYFIIAGCARIGGGLNFSSNYYVSPSLRGFRERAKLRPDLNQHKSRAPSYRDHCSIILHTKLAIMIPKPHKDLNTLKVKIIAILGRSTFAPLGLRAGAKVYRA